MSLILKSDFLLPAHWPRPTGVEGARTNCPAHLCPPTCRLHAPSLLPHTNVLITKTRTVFNSPRVKLLFECGPNPLFSRAVNWKVYLNGFASAITSDFVESSSPSNRKLQKVLHALRLAERSLKVAVLLFSSAAFNSHFGGGGGGVVAVNGRK